MEHPVFTAQGKQDWVYDENNNPVFWPVDNYFTEGQRQAVFLGEEVIKYHKTITTYISCLLKNGFVITGFSEPTPTDEMLKNIEGMKNELRRPMMLIISARKE